MSCSATDVHPALSIAVSPFQFVVTFVVGEDKTPFEVVELTMFVTLGWYIARSTKYLCAAEPWEENLEAYVS